MTKQEMVKWLIRALSNEVNKNSYAAWRYAGALDAFMVMDGYMGKGEKLVYDKKPVYCSVWVDERKEYYPEYVLRKSLEFYI